MVMLESRLAPDDGHNNIEANLQFCREICNDETIRPDARLRHLCRNRRNRLPA
jgi:hypothetical protein